jgi:hypothetical protein
VNGIINLLANSGYIILNKAIIKKLGLHEAIIVGELCSEYMYWEKNGKLEDNYFYSTRENIHENTGLSAYQQREPMKKLINIGVILEKSKGMPLQKWYSLNSELLYKILCENLDLTTSSEETAKQDIKKFNNNISRNLISSNQTTKEYAVKKLNSNNNNYNNKNNIYLYNNEQKIKFRDKVFLTQKQYNELIQKFGKEKIDNLVTRLDLYKKSTGKDYKDDYATILLWINSSMKKSNLDFKEESYWMKNAKEKYGNNLEGLYANYNNFFIKSRRENDTHI